MDGDDGLLTKEFGMTKGFGVTHRVCGNPKSLEDQEVQEIFPQWATWRRGLTKIRISNFAWILALFRLSIFAWLLSLFNIFFFPKYDPNTTVIVIGQINLIF